MVWATYLDWPRYGFKCEGTAEVGELTVTLPPETLEAITERAAELVAERQSPARQEWMTTAEAAD